MATGNGNGNGNGLNKLAIAALLGALLSGAGGWLVFGSNVPDRAEVRQIATDSCLYREDRNLVLESLERIEQSLQEIVDALDTLDLP